MKGNCSRHLLCASCELLVAWLFWDAAAARCQLPEAAADECHSPFFRHTQGNGSAGACRRLLSSNCCSREGCGEAAVLPCSGPARTERLCTGSAGHCAQGERASFAFV